MLLRPLAVCLATGLAAQAPAATPQEAAALYDALALDAVIEVMREEGKRHGRSLAEDMFPERLNTGWDETVEAIYDTDRMARSVRRDFARALKDTDAAPLLAFFEADLGQRIIALEVGAREAMLDPDVEEVARSSWADMLATGDPRIVVLEAYVDANDLVESNVSGSMNANYAFYQGLAEGRAFDGALTEDEMLAEVWAQEEAIRLDTEDWVYAYLALAYRPLEDGDVEAYTTLSRTEPGRELNRALFVAFDAMYAGVSHALGLAAAGEMAGTDI